MRAPWLLHLAVVMLAVAIALGPKENAVAQRPDQPQIIVAPIILAAPGSQISLEIRIGPLEALPRNSFVRLRGLPHPVSLTEGYSIGPGSWAVSLNALPKLKANVPAGEFGRSDLVIQLIATDGTVLAEARTALFMGTAAVGSRGGAAEALTPSVTRQDPAVLLPPLSAEDRTRAQKFVDQGEGYLRQGNIAGARLLFRRAAEAGYAPAAIRLGATYDPAELDRLQVQGVPADRAEARKWYERARELGAPEAAERLARLGGS
jgi:hypothetical protein